MTPEEMAGLLEEDRARLEGYVSRHAGATLRHETVEDLIQEIHLDAVRRADRFEYRSRPEFEAWVLRIARAHLADRRDYWTAAKRRPERLLRLTRADSDSSDPGSIREPARPTPGPATRADDADRLKLAERALTLLLPRDAELVRGDADGRSIEEEAERLGLTYGAAQRARVRARERYRRAFRLLEQGAGA